ncbi:MAG: CBS domain-containing protein, partial [Anaerolineae bacterium]|nr:CBS domain-containing protein [Anaerolineae bacterium]
MTDIPIQEIPTYTRKDFVSDQTVRWCPGCGDYAILAAVQKALPELGVRREDTVFISGIGCSSRFPYYMNTYGIHSIHGRAPTLAAGLKVARPDLSIWIVTGDGDGLSIGGNHLLHMCRRNVDVNILLFNNRIYGLTKGQYSPTSLPGHKTKSSPMGSIEQSFNPLSVTLGAEATFVARSIDTLNKHLDEVIKQAAAHKGTSFVEIFQNCVIFNDNAWTHVSDKNVQDDNAIFLEADKPMIFGKNRDKGLRLNGLRLEVVTLGAGVSEADLMLHDPSDRNLAYILTQMEYPSFPVPFGVIYAVDKPTYETQLMGQVHSAQQKGKTDLKSLYHSDYTWTVEADMRSVRVTDTTEMVISAAMDEEYLDDMEREMAGVLAAAQSGVHQGLAQDPLANLHSGKHLVTVTPDATLAEAIAIMQDSNIGALLVVDAARHPVGIFTERDVLFRVATRVTELREHTIDEFMTPNPDVLRADVPIAHALHLMTVHHYRHVPMIDDQGRAISIISFRDVVSYIEKYFDR